MPADLQIGVKNIMPVERQESVLFAVSQPKAPYAWTARQGIHKQSRSGVESMPPSSDVETAANPSSLGIPDAEPAF